MSIQLAALPSPLKVVFVTLGTLFDQTQRWSQGEEFLKMIQNSYSSTNRPGGDIIEEKIPPITVARHSSHLQML